MLVSIFQNIHKAFKITKKNIRHNCPKNNFIIIIKYFESSLFFIKNFFVSFLLLIFSVISFSFNNSLPNHFLFFFKFFSSSSLPRLSLKFIFFYFIAICILFYPVDPCNSLSFILKKFLQLFLF